MTTRLALDSSETKKERPLATTVLPTQVNAPLIESQAAKTAIVCGVEDAQMVLGGI